MERLEHLVAEHLETRLLESERLRDLFAIHLDRRDERRRELAAEMTNRASAAEVRLKPLYDAIENGVADLDDPSLKSRVEELKAMRDQARIDADRRGPPPRARERRSRPTSPAISRPSPAAGCVEKTADFGATICELWRSGSRSRSVKSASWAHGTSFCGSWYPQVS